jgi:hypothetical protein
VSVAKWERLVTALYEHHGFGTVVGRRSDLPLIHRRSYKRCSQMTALCSPKTSEKVHLGDAPLSSQAYHVTMCTRRRGGIRGEGLWRSSGEVQPLSERGRG